MIAVDIVQMTIVQVIHMITMRHDQMTVAFTMHVISVKRGVHDRFAYRIGVRDVQNMLIHVTVMHKMKMIIVQIVPMIDMPDFGMAAIIAMHVCVIVVNSSIVRFRCDRAGTEDSDCGSERQDMAHKGPHV